jgi:hypothetical protein
MSADSTAPFVVDRAHSATLPTPDTGCNASQRTAPNCNTRPTHLEIGASNARRSQLLHFKSVHDLLEQGTRGIGDCCTDTKVMAIRYDERASHLRRPAIASPYVGGSDQEPRDIRTLWRWRESRRGPSFLKIGGRYFYTIGALRLPALMGSDWNCRRQTLGQIPTTLRNTRVKWAWSHIPQARATCERGSRVFSMMTWA